MTKNSKKELLAEGYSLLAIADSVVSTVKVLDMTQELFITENVIALIIDTKKVFSCPTAVLSDGAWKIIKVIIIYQLVTLLTTRCAHRFILYLSIAF
ncbi:hypothetical protein ATO12_23335 [Aquimarina atlantica]|uniref:Uncharacterized protein n=1 Tax=Aquimarina atlantica TaxID=1317122 RepID=A0A023BRC2_9FLAO|nr:hypothetical protein ATO12_23335 [Aquimarina atlantica]